MLVAGSVLALLLMGLTVDGILHPEEEDGPDESPEGGDLGGEGEMVTMAVDDFLSGGDVAKGEDQGLHARAEAVGYTPLDAAETHETEEGAYAAKSAPQFLVAEAPEGAADTLHDDELPEDGMLNVFATTTLDDGSEVPLVTSFEASTDTLVMEFEGSENESPVITVEQGLDGEDAVVSANGLPVTVVQDAPDLTEKHIRVVMDILPGLETSAEADADLDLAPVIEPIADEVEEISDGVPGATLLDGLLDDLGGSLSDVGGATDVLDARADMDAAFGTGGTDAITGSFNDDVLTGGDGQDALFGDEGDDALDGGSGNDELYGDFGDDALFGGEGTDFLSGGEDNDMLDGGADRDVLFGDEGDDALFGGDGDDILHGGAGADILDGGAGDDVLNGTFGHGDTDQDASDILRGGDGNDAIILGAGDVAEGGDGSDTFTGGDYIDDVSDVGIVTDFDPAEDRIEVIYDAGSNPNPVIEVQDFADGTGADIILNGQVILSVSGAQGLDPNLIDLRAST